MSKLKNIFGLPESLIQAASEIHETSHLSPKQEKIAKLAGDPKKIDAEDFHALRQKKKMMKDSVEMNHGSQLNELDPGTYIKYAMTAKAKQKPGEVNPRRDSMIDLAMKKAQGGPVEIIRNSYEPDSESILEYDYKAHQQGQYPFSANQLTPLFAMLKSLLNFVQGTPALKKIMREETGLEHVDLVPTLNFLEALAEELTEMKDEHDEEEDSEKEEKDSEADKHPMMQLKTAADNGSFLTTSSGPKYVNKSLAGQILSHLSSLKPSERQEHLDKLVDNEHPGFSSKIDQSHENKPKNMEPPVQKKRGRKPKSKN